MSRFIAEATPFKKFMPPKMLKKIILLSTALLWLALPSLSLYAAEADHSSDLTIDSSDDSPAKDDAVDSAYTDSIQLIEGELEQIKVYNLTRISITDPDIADVVDANENQVLLVASAPGETVLFLWDDKGKRSIKIHVSRRDLTEVRDRLKKLFSDVNLNEAIVKIDKDEGKVVVSGEIPKEKQALFNKIVKPFDDEIIKLAIAEENENMIQINMQITELSQTLAKSLGVDWSAGDSSSTNSTNSNNTTASTNNALTVPYKENIPNFNGSVGNLFKVGDFSRTEALTATVNALIEKGKARVLSQPRLMVKNGEEASFLVGGEVPIRTTTTTSGGNTQENVQFKEFGVGMTLKPTLRKKKIEIVLNVEISDIDPANSSGNDVAFVTRSANTTLLLDDNQTTVMAGLIRQAQSELVRKVPFMGDIPVLGLLFRSRSTPTADQQTEVVISITPHIVNTGVPSVFKKDEDNQPSSADERQPVMRRPPPDRGLSLPKEMREYVQQVQEKISRAIVYPKEAEQYGWEGTVKVGLHILDDGTLAYALVKQSSGIDIIDDVAVKTAEKVAPFSGFPPGTNLHEINVTIPIVYSLKRN